MKWRVLSYQKADSAWNMAVDEAILTSYLEGKSPPTLRFYGWSPPAVSVGYFQDVEREIRIDQLSLRGFDLVRRNTGGRAVLHDQELTYSIVAGIKEGLPDSLLDSYLYISKAFVNALKALGVEAELNQGGEKHAVTGACFESPSWYEITVNGKKLIGSAQYRHNGSFLQHGSILLDFSASDLGAVLKIPTGSAAGFYERLQAKISSLDQLGVKLEPEKLAALIVDSFRKLYGITFLPGYLTESEILAANSLVIGKYATDEWNYQRGNSRSQMRLNGIEAGNG